MLKKISLVCGLILALSSILGIIYTLDSRWAKAADVSALSQRLDEKIQADRADRVQEKVWKLQDRYDGKVMPQTERELYRELLLELDKLKKKGDK